MTIAALPIDWDLLIAAGVPLLSSDLSYRSIDWKSVAAVTRLATQSELKDREEFALRSWLIALRDHYSSTYVAHFSDSKIDHFINAKPIDGRLIKLRRLACSRLSKVA